MCLFWDSYITGLAVVIYDIFCSFSFSHLPLASFFLAIFLLLPPFFSPSPPSLPPSSLPPPENLSEMAYLITENEKLRHKLKKVQQRRDHYARLYYRIASETDETKWELAIAKGKIRELKAQGVCEEEGGKRGEKGVSAEVGGAGKGNRLKCSNVRARKQIGRRCECAACVNYWKNFTPCYWITHVSSCTVYQRWCVYMMMVAIVFNLHILSCTHNHMEQYIRCIYIWRICTQQLIIDCIVLYCEFGNVETVVNYIIVWGKPVWGKLFQGLCKL